MPTMVCMTAVPEYLSDAYWWAYVHPNAVRLFERRWLVNLILFGNLRRLAEAALAALGGALPGRTLQVGCVYGDLTARVAERVCADGRLDVADVLPVQLDNLARKLAPGAPVRLIHGDSTGLPLASASYDRVLLFFLLHEQPEHARRATVAEALRLVKPGGHVAIVDYHRPRPWHPLYWPMVAILRLLEPYALDLWRHEIETWLPRPIERVEKATAFGGLYQILRITV